MTKQIFPFLFCFIRELNPYSPPGRALSLWLNRVKDSIKTLTLRALSLWLNRVKDSIKALYTPLTFSLCPPIHPKARGFIKTLFLPPPTLKIPPSKAF